MDMFGTSSRRWLNGLMILGCLAAIMLAGWLIAAGSASLVAIGIVLIPAALLMLLNPQSALITLNFAVYSFEYFVGLGWFPTVGLWAIDGLVILLFVQLMLFRRKRPGFFFRGPLFVLVVIWVGMVILSAAANGSSLLQFVLGIRVYVRFLILYFCLLEGDWEEQFLARSVQLFTILFLVQIPIALMQIQARLGYDEITGTLAASGGTGLISMVAMGFFAGILGYGVYSGKRSITLLSVSVLILPILATARAFAIVAPLVVGYAVIRLFHWKALWQVGMAVIVMSILLMSWSFRTGGVNYRAVDLVRNPALYLDELLADPVEGTTGASVGRLRALSLTWLELSQSGRRLFFGFGPATAQGSRFISLQSELYERLALTGGRSSQLTRSLLEWGLLGTLAYGAIFAFMWMIAERAFKRLTDPLWKATAFGYAVFVPVALVLVTYTTSWSATASSFIFWFIGALLTRKLHSQTGVIGSD